MQTEQAPLRLPEFLRERVKEHGFTLMEFAKQAQITYEHGRRILKGESVPSRRLVVSLAELLDIDPAHALRLYDTDRRTLALEKLKPPKDPPEEVPVSWTQLWPRLSRTERSDLMSLATRWITRRELKEKKFGHDPAYLADAI